MKLRPLQDRIIVKRLDEESKTKGGIIIPDTAKEKPQRGEVTAVGDDEEMINVAVGDTVGVDVDLALTAGQALDWGLATAHADEAGLEQAVAELVGHLLGKKTGSVRCTRRLMRPADLESRLERERALFVEQIVTAEAMAGIKAWLGDD